MAVILLKREVHNTAIMITSRAVRYDDIYRMDEIKSLSFHIYCIFFVLLQLVSYPYFITDRLFIFSEVELFFLSLSLGLY